jgi:hypothetical protein
LIACEYEFFRGEDSLDKELGVLEHSHHGSGDLLNKFIGLVAEFVHD